MQETLQQILTEPPSENDSKHASWSINGGSNNLLERQYTETYNSFRLLRPLDGCNDVEYFIEYLIIHDVHWCCYLVIWVFDIANVIREVQIALNQQADMNCMESGHIAFCGGTQGNGRLLSSSGVKRGFYTCAVAWDVVCSTRDDLQCMGRLKVRTCL